MAWKSEFEKAIADLERAYLESSLANRAAEEWEDLSDNLAGIIAVRALREALPALPDDLLQSGEMLFDWIEDMGGFSAIELSSEDWKNLILQAKGGF